MKVKELKKALEELDPNLEIVLSSDGEGNSFGLMYNVERGLYYLDGEIYCEEDKPKRAKEVVVLFPR